VGCEGVAPPADLHSAPGSATPTSSTIQPALRRSLSTSTRWSKARCAGMVLPSARNMTGALAAAILRNNSSSSSVSARPGGSYQNSRH
jgi:hypothetical protein